MSLTLTQLRVYGRAQELLHCTVQFLKYAPAASIIGPQGGARFAEILLSARDCEVCAR